MVATRQQQQNQQRRDGVNDDTQKATKVGPASTRKQETRQANGKKATSPSCSPPESSRLDDFLFKPISIAPLVYFRIVFGAIMLWEVIRFFKGNKIRRYYIEPDFYFRYFGFHWMPGPLGGNWMFVFFLGMGILYVFLILGLWYRLTSILLFLGFAYWFFLDMTTYLNHFYLVLLISFVMTFLPAHRNASLDVLRCPELRVSQVPAWTRWLLTLTVSIPYFFGGVAKFTGDWLKGEPMRMWLLDKIDFPIFGHLFAEWWATYFFSWNGLVFDLLIVPMLLWKRTRVVAIASTLFFHLMNDKLFTIGIFPWFMMFATPLFFEPDWVKPVLKFEWIFREPIHTDRVLADPTHRRPIVKWLFCSYLAWQFLMPFRVHLYPGFTNWTEEGYLYSWHMMLRNKDGWADFTVTFEGDDDGDEDSEEEKKKVIDVDQDKFLSKLQRRRMVERPDMVYQFGQFLCRHYGKKSRGPVRVNVDHMMSLNGRKRQHMVDPTVDLCEAKISMGPSSWIVPLTVPLSDKDPDVILEMIDFADGNDYVGSRIAKTFTGEDGIFFGTVTEYVHGPTRKKRVWKVLFDDGDEDRFDRKDLTFALYMHQENKEDDLDLNGSKAEKNMVQSKEAEEDEDDPKDDHEEEKEDEAEL